MIIAAPISRQGCLLAALEAIDAGAFPRAPTLPESFWRRRGQRSNRGHLMTALLLQRGALVGKLSKERRVIGERAQVE